MTACPPFTPLQPHVTTVPDRHVAARVPEGLLGDDVDAARRSREWVDALSASEDDSDGDGGDVWRATDITSHPQALARRSVRRSRRE